MRIQSAQIQLSGQRSFTQHQEQSESLSVTIGSRQSPREAVMVSRDSVEVGVMSATSNSLSIMTQGRPGRPGRSMMNGLANFMDRVELSPRAHGLLQGNGPKKGDKDELEAGSELEMFKVLMEKLLKHKVDIEGFEEAEFTGVSIENPGNAARQSPSAGFSLAYDYHESFYESESTSFAAQGVVKTADGKEINFQVGLDMSREYYREENISIRMGDAANLVDPLVVNFNGAAADLTDAKFSFDLTADGETEEMSFLKSNSGFLAFDKNGNGSIDDGSELFGPTTGDGFAELAEYDEDKNLFIDEADSIYSKLSVYNKDSEGNDVVRSLSDTGVGAIYLGRVDTEFSINDTQNQQKGQIRETGIYLEEDGGVGTIQEIDVAV